MAIVKALLIAGLVTLGLFLLITVIIWIIPILIFVGIFSIIAFIAYAMIRGDEERQWPLKR